MHYGIFFFTKCTSACCIIILPKWGTKADNVDGIESCLWCVKMLPYRPLTRFWSRAVVFISLSMALLLCKLSYFLSDDIKVSILKMHNYTSHFLLWSQVLTELKSDNQRLKDENGALIRVISKLSKWRRPDIHVNTIQRPMLRKQRASKLLNVPQPDQYHYVICGALSPRCCYWKIQLKPAWAGFTQFAG